MLTVEFSCILCYDSTSMIQVVAAEDGKMRFFNDIKKYWSYTVRSAKAELKSEVASSYLSWLWWILDPLLFMMVYTFIAVIVFEKGGKYFPIFVFIGLTMWNFFNTVILGSVKIVKNNSATVSKVYIPKFILVIKRMMVNGFKMAISFILVFILMGIYRVPVSYHILYIFPVLVVMMLVTFGVSNLMLHFGVFVEDLRNVMTVVMRLCFYMSGIFYSISERVPEPYNRIMQQLNPAAFLIDSARQSLIYSGTPARKVLLVWGVVGLILSVLSIKVVYKYENSYVKVI